MKHWETHPSFVDGCFGCKITTVTADASALTRERNGVDVTMGMGTEAYVKRMYRRAREEGKPDPIPATKAAARYAPAAGVDRGKNYKKVNNGL